MTHSPILAFISIVSLRDSYMELLKKLVKPGMKTALIKPATNRYAQAHG